MLVAACGRRAPAPPGTNPHPVRLVRPAAVGLSPIARIGRDIFFDERLSGSGRMACATCHEPALAYGAPERIIQASRAIPALRYVDRVPPFAIGPDREDAGPAPPLLRGATAGSRFHRPPKIAEGASGGPAMVPHGGLFWDGRAASLQEQAASPLLNPNEMANGSSGVVAAKLRAMGYTARLSAVIGAPLSDSGSPSPVDEALFAVARFEVEEPSFHPYSSRYDRWLEGDVALSSEELQGLHVFEDPTKGNCAACHPDRPHADGTPPDFTDWQYEALGVPRNTALATTRDPRYFDLGLCGPQRTDLAAERQWCGTFRTPSLRNVAVRQTLFHNGVYHTLEQVVRFYNFRDVRPDLIYPAGRAGVHVFDDLPPALARNVDENDPPFGRSRGGPPPMTDQEMRSLISFLRTLTDADCSPAPGRTHSRR